MTNTEIKNIIQQQLPELISNDPLMRDFILRTVSEYYTPKQETESKFDTILTELRLDREEQARKWDENKRQWDENNRRLDDFMHQQNLKWDEQNRKWDENNRRLDEFMHQQNLKWEENKQQWHEQHELNKAMLAEIKKLDKTYNSTIGALGSRWGLSSEASFRNGLKGILEDSFGVQVLNVNEFDSEGEVFGRPDQVEIDVIIKNGLLILCEIKSSIDKAGMYIFDRKVAFYEKRHQRKANRKMVICPMVDDRQRAALRDRAKPVAQNLGIELYSDADSVELN